MSFSFRLDPVLRVRGAEREVRQRELAAALAQERECEQAILVITSEIAQARLERTIEPRTITVERLQAADTYEALLRQRRQVQVALRAEAAEVVHQRRAALLAADRAVRALEILRETDRARYQAELQRRETRDLDELATRPSSST